MAEDQDSSDKSKQFEDRLSYLEMIARDTAARLYQIEKQMGLVFHAVPREMKPPVNREPKQETKQEAQIQNETERTGAPAINETVAGSEPAKPIVSPDGSRQTSGAHRNPHRRAPPRSTKPWRALSLRSLSSRRMSPDNRVGLYELLPNGRDRRLLSLALHTRP